ncbi:MAG TPA: hypothetical protein VKE74_23735 [Gemmataceae bacterium]|nr:hypothetical protein [Gemmataceae bacterium]
MSTAVADRPLTDRARDVLKRAGNPFRNYFARNPDDEVCARYHVPELFAPERDLLHAIIDLYRYDPMTHSEVVPVLGNKGAGKTHLLHSIKHGAGGQWQLLVTPGVYQKDTDFLEYLLFQIIDTLLGGGKQKGVRPLEYISDQLVRRQLGVALRDLSADEKVELFPPPGLGRWARRLGLGTQQAAERADWLAENLSGYSNFARMPTPLPQALADAGLTPQKAFDLVTAYVGRTEAHNTAGLMRRHIFAGFAKAALLKDEADLANFLTYGFAELEFHVRPTRQDLVLALFKVLTEIFRSLKTPVVVAFDQLEDLLLARRSDDAHKTAEAFFAGIVHVMHQIDGLLFTIFAERGLWNRFVPSLDGYIQDRLNNPVHVPKHGTVKTLRLEAPPADLVRRVVEARLRPCLEELPEGESFTEITPFTDDQVMRVAATEPTLRDMLQQYRHLFDHVVYGPDEVRTEAPRRASSPEPLASPERERGETAPSLTSLTLGARQNPPELDEPPVPVHRIDASGDIPFGRPPVSEPPAEQVPVPLPPDPINRVAALLGGDDEPEITPEVTIKSVTVVETPAEPPALPASEADTDQIATAPPDVDEPSMGIPVDVPVTELPPPSPAPAAEEVPPALPFPVAGSEPSAPVVRSSALSHAALVELWDQEQRAARRKLEPEGALTGATRELQAGLGAFLAVCHEHGVKVGPWRLQHVVPEWSFGDHPTYGVVTIAHWACKDAQPWKVGIGLFLARGAGKPKDLEVKLSVMDVQPVMVDHLILLRPEDDLALSGKSKSLWQDAERRGRHPRLEPASLDGFAQLYSFPRWLAAVRESLPEGTPLPNLADVIQEKCEQVLPQLCMPVQG